MGRGLSPLQQGIMKHATEHGYINPFRASELAVNSFEGWQSKAYRVVASRSLRRLCERGLLVQERVHWGHHHQRVYRLPTFTGKYEADVIERKECPECSLNKVDF